MKKIYNLGLLSLLLSLFLITSVQAASSSTFSIESKKIDKEDKKITMECRVSGAGTVTNGKFRITYDPQKLTLEEVSAGNGLSDIMVQINDPVTGNKQEGEIVMVFAAAQPVSIDGILLKMNFRNKGLKDGESTDVALAVEEFASESDDLTGKVESEKGTVSMGDGISSEINGDSSTVKGSATSKPGIIKTGDDTEIARNVAMAAGALFLLILVGATIKRKKDSWYCQ